MDPITAVGLAAAILQFLQFGSNVVSNAVEIQGSGTTRRNADIEAVICDFRNLDLDMRRKQLSLSANHSLKARNGLDDLSEKCQELSDELLGLLEKMRKSPNSGSFKSIRAGLKAVTSKNQVDTLKAKFDTYRELLLYKEVLEIKHQITALEAHKRFDNLDRQTMLLLNALEEGRQKLFTEVNKQSYNFSEQLNVLGKRSRGDMEEIVQSEGRRIREYINETDSNRMRQLQELHQNFPFPGSNPNTTGNLTDALLRSLAFPEMDTRREDVPEAHSQTFGWIFEPQGHQHQLFSNFCDWLEGEEEPCYWISGKAGSGKSTLMSLIWDAHKTGDCLEIWAAEKELIRLSFFFWKPGVKLQKSLQGLYRALIYQLIIKAPSLGPLAIESLDSNQKFSLGQSHSSNLSWSEKRLRSLFKTLLQSVSRHKKVFIFIDALDEFEDKEHTELDLLERLDEIMTIPGTKTCVSSRPLPIYVGHFADMPGLKLQDLTGRDIHIYVDDKLKHKLLQYLNPKPTIFEVDDFIHDMVERASGVFLWIRLVTQDVLQALPKGDNLQELESRLSETPTELEDLFQHMQKQLDKCHRKYAEEYLVLRMCTSKSLFLSLFALATWPPLQSTDCSALSVLSRDSAIEHIKHVQRVLPARAAGLLEISELKSDYSSRLHNGGDGDGLSSRDFVDFLHRSVYDWLLSDTGPSWLSKEGMQIALEKLLKACIFVCNSFKLPLDADTENFALALPLDDSLDLASLVRRTFALASDLEERFGVTRPDLLDELGLVLSKHSRTDPWPKFYVSGVERLVVQDFPGFAVTHKLWLYCDAKARQKASTDLGDYATYLLSCIRLLEIEPRDMQGAMAFLDRRLQDGANVNATLQVEQHRLYARDNMTDRDLNMIFHETMYRGEGLYLTFWIKVLKVLTRTMRYGWTISLPIVMAVANKCLDAGANMDVVVREVRELNLVGDAFLRPKRIKLYIEVSASYLLDKALGLGVTDPGSVRKALNNRPGKVNLLGVALIERGEVSKMACVRSLSRESSVHLTDDDLARLRPLEEAIRDDMSNFEITPRVMQIWHHLEAIWARGSALRWSFDDKLNECFNMNIDVPENTMDSDVSMSQ